MKTNFNFRRLACFLSLTTLMIFKGYSQDPPKPAHHYYTFMSVGAGISSIKADGKNLSGLEQSLAYYFSAKEEWQYSERINFLLGLDLMSSGCTFNSYFFTVPDSVRIYNGDLDNSYSVRFNQFNVPVLLRINYFDKKKDRHCFYTDIGPSFQFMIPGRVEVSKNNNPVKNEQVVPSFVNADAGVFSSIMINASAGIQFYKGSSNFGWDIEFNARYSPNPMKLKVDYVAKDLEFNQFILGISGGIRF
jgi:hypothetical protein